MGATTVAAGSVFTSLAELEIAVNACVRKDGFQYAKKKEGNTTRIFCKSRDCQASFVAVKDVSTSGSSWHVTSVNRQHTCSPASIPSSSSSPARAQRQFQQQRTFMPTPSESDHSSDVSTASSAHVASMLMRKKETPQVSPDKGKGKGREIASDESSSVATPRPDIQAAVVSARKSAPTVSFPASPATVIILQCKGCEDRGLLCSGKPAENRLCPECIHYNEYSGKRHIICGIASRPRRIEPVLDASISTSDDEDEELDKQEPRASFSGSTARRSPESEPDKRTRNIRSLDNLFDDPQDAPSGQTESPRKRKQRPSSPSPSSESFVSSSTTSRSARSLHGDDSYAASDVSSAVVQVKQEEEPAYSSKRQKVSEAKTTPVRHSPRFARKTSVPWSSPKVKLEGPSVKRTPVAEAPEERILQSRWRSSDSRSSSPSVEVCAKSSAISPLASLKRRASRNTPVSLDPAVNEENSQSPSYTRSIRQSSKKKAIPAWAAEVDDDDQHPEPPQIVHRRLSGIPGFPPRVSLRFQALKVETLEDLSRRGVMAQDHKDLIKFLMTAPIQKPLDDEKEEAFDEIEAWLAERRLSEAMAAI